MDKLHDGVKKRLNSPWIAKLLVIVIVVSVAGATIAFWIIGKRVEASLAEQMLHRQQIVARAGAYSIEDFLNLTGASVSSYAALEEIIEGSEAVQDKLGLFVDEWLSTPVFSIVLTDENGVVTYSANRQGVGQRGASLTDRDYFQWAKNAKQGEVFVGKAIYGKFGSVEDKFFIPVASGVFSDGEYRGVLIATVVLSELTKSYLDPLKISEETRIYLVDQYGFMLHAPYEQFIGENYFDYLAKTDFKGKEYAVGKLWKAISKAEEGKIDIVLPNEQGGGADRFLISHSPVRLSENKYFTLAVASPINVALVFFPQFQPHQFGVLIFIIFVVLALSALGLLAIRLAQREAYFEGFARGRDTVTRSQKAKSKIKKIE